MTEQKPPVDDNRPRPKTKHATARVDDEEGRRGTDTHRRLALDKQNADISRLCGRDLRLRVVVSEDPAVPIAMPPIPLGTPLTHPDTVTPAATVEQKNGSARSRRWKRKSDDYRYHPDPHRGQQNSVEPRPRPRSGVPAGSLSRGAWPV
jgi:hypothetical protein